MDNEEITELHRYYNSIKNDKRKVTEFMKINHKLTACEIATITNSARSKDAYNASSVDFFEYDNKLVIKKQHPKPVVQGKSTSIRSINVDVPDDWRTNREWMFENYIINNYSQPELASAIGVSQPTLHKHIVRLGLYKSRTSGTNKTSYKNERWLIDNTNTPLHEMAKIASVTEKTIKRWIKIFRINR